MKIGIVGAGLIGSNLARLFVKAGHDVKISFSKTAGKLQHLVTEIGGNISAGTPAEAVDFADVVVLSVHFKALDEAIRQMGNISNKVIIDTSNPFGIHLEKGHTAANEVKERLPGVKLVKAYNTFMYTQLLKKSAQEPACIVPYCGDDDQANAQVAKLITDSGFLPYPLGPLSKAYIQEPGGVLYGHPLTKEEADSLLA